MRRRIRLTESDLNRIVRESVDRILHEGQGWQFFKNGIKDTLTNDYEKFGDWDEIKDYINTGGSDMSKPDGYYYYDKEGCPTTDIRKSQGAVNRGLSGKIGRAAAVGGLGAAYGLRKMGKGIKNGIKNIGKKIERRNLKRKGEDDIDYM